MVNRKKCKETLLNKRLLKNTDKTKFGFPASTNIFVNENKSPYFNHLAYRCRVLKRANKIHSHSFSKGKLYLQRTIGERPKIITHVDDILGLYPDFKFECDSNTAEAQS